MDAWLDYDLPPELVAQEPLRNRADARLMIVDRRRGSIDHAHVRDLPELLRSSDRLVLNDTRVVPAQLRGTRIETGGRWQGLFLGTLPDGEWKLLCKTRGHLRAPEPVTLLDRDGRAAAKLWLIERLDDGQWRARLDEPVDSLELLERVGRVPLPPYIRGGNMVDADVERYQTVYARRPGAVAAPTAGLHFTGDLLKQLAARGVELSAVTLHVGMGTFRPISVPDPAEHPMHAEWAEVTAAAAREISETRRAGRRIVAVGTTAVRTLETAAADEASRGDELVGPWSGETRLFIRPGYEFRAVDALVTNFHFPRTTLLLLVQAFGGTELIRQAYAEAVAEQYRFYSYGDAMLIQ
ncbi:MAG TPA: tRNA preQ1(34) S-adenosylmethionine ribosyltransferase-isomerase QueA [Lacipirellulaceae bacterium]|nr:tRNA preQ1(34) S-adenosylmethionine ribosyltransferase-isomerase QueA [Lacipirellulaceae bacterium]